MKIVNKVFKVELGCRLDLDVIYRKTHCVILRRRPFKNLHWQLKKLGGSCILYESGKGFFWVNDPLVIRKYCRLIQKMDFDVKPKIQMITSTATHQLKENVNMVLQENLPQSSLEMELFPGLMVKRHGMNFTVFSSGKVNISGIKSLENEMDAIAVLLEMEIILQG